MTAKTLTLRAEEELIIEVGSTQIRLDAKGLHLVGASIGGVASEKLSFSGAGAAMSLDGKAAMSGEFEERRIGGDALSLDSKASLQGSKVELGGGGGGGPEKDSKKDPNFDDVELVLVDQENGPWVSKRFSAVADGFVTEGTTTAKGVAKIKVPKKAKAAQLRLWIGDYPKGDTIVLDIALETKPLPEGTLGALHRLRHLGHYDGLAEDGWSADAQAALLAFQQQHVDDGLEPTGELDAKTTALLAKLHGH